MLVTELIDVNVASIGDASKPSPRVNLSSQEHVRYELCRVYRDAKAGQLPTGVATKLAYILICINKMLEAEVAKTDNTITIVNNCSTLEGIDLGSLDKEQLMALEIAIHTIESIRDGKPIPTQQLFTEEQYARILKEALSQI